MAVFTREKRVAVIRVSDMAIIYVLNSECQRITETTALVYALNVWQPHWRLLLEKNNL